MSQENKTVNCEECKEEIFTQDDLIVAMERAEICPYHASCYGKNLKKYKGFSMNDTPINGARSTALLIISFIVAVIALVVGDGMRVLVLLFLIQGAFRLYSYLKYERHVPK